MALHYPSDLSNIKAWCADNGVDVNEGRVRFAQYGILLAIASSRVLSSILVFKGGNALDFVWQPNRSTRDLDFSLDMATEGISWNAASFENLVRDSLGQSLKISTDRLGVLFAVQGVKKQPPGPDKTFVTFRVPVGYALPDQKRLVERILVAGKSEQLIPVEISLNELVCDAHTVDIQARNKLRISSVEDIVAEKLRALLQQPIRNRRRRQDLLDIAIIRRERSDLDLTRIAEYLVQKSAARDVVVSRAAFRNPEVAERAASDYPELEQTTRKLFIPYEEALGSLLDLVDLLPIPEDPPTK